MRIEAVTVGNHAPFDRVSLSGMSDRVVIAGPNGVGKTRLLNAIIFGLRSGPRPISEATQRRASIPNPDLVFDAVIAATCDEEREEWGADTLTLSMPSDAARFKATIQRRMTRRDFRSSLTLIESDRRVVAVRPLPPMRNPRDKEPAIDDELPWDATLKSLRERYDETVRLLVQLVRVESDQFLAQARDARSAGQPGITFDPTRVDPIKPFRDAFKALVGPKELVDPSLDDTTLHFRLGAEVNTFNALSSGELEAVTICFDFLMRQPRDCIVFFDEPELHLHAELAQRMLDTLAAIGHNNQFFLTTHAPAIISASIDGTVVLLSGAADPETGNQAHVVNNASEAHDVMRILGHSLGTIVRGQRIVLIEGEEPSLDKVVYDRLARSRFPSLTMVPVRDVGTLRSYASASERIMSKTIWGVEFFMLADGDAAASTVPTGNRSNDHFRVLPRYHIENYFLDEETWWAALGATLDPRLGLRSPADIRSLLRGWAEEHVPRAVALRVSASLRGQIGSMDLMPRLDQHASRDQVVAAISRKAESEIERLSATISYEEVRRTVAMEFDRLDAAVTGDTNEWKYLVPGRPIVATWARHIEINLRTAKATYLEAAEKSANAVFQEILDIFEQFERL